MPTPALIAEYVSDLVRRDVTAITQFIGTSVPEAEEAMRLLTSPGAPTLRWITAFQLVMAALEERRQGSAQEEDTDPSEQPGWEALAAGDLELAVRIADALLERSRELPDGHWNFGNLVHHGHIIRGYAFLRGGDVAGATSELLAAGQTPGSPQLDSFGPDLNLAWELLRRGRDDAVLAYLRNVSTFWAPMGSLQLLVHRRSGET